MSHDGVGPRAVMRSVAFLTASVLAVTALAGCGSDEPVAKPLAAPDILPAARDLIADGGTLHWAVDAVPETLNTFQSDADATTNRVAQAVLPAMYRTDAAGRPVRDADYLESAKVVDTEPRQVVLYKLDQRAVWSDGREIGAADFAAQWRALSGRDSAYWTARNAGYDRIEKIERGDNDLEVKVTFTRPYADWRSLFSPLYPKDVMGTPDAFNDAARRTLRISAGPFAVQKVAVEDKQVVLVRNPRWWGRRAKLDKLVLDAVPRADRVEALGDGTLDVADVDPADAERIAVAGRPHGTGTPLQGPERQKETGAGNGLAAFDVRKSLEPAYTQLALNGSGGPLADERVRRAVARTLDRAELAGLVLKPLGLPAVPVGSHLALAGQPAYADNSGALGDQDTAQAQALLASAGWVPGGPVKDGATTEKAAGGSGEKAEGAEKAEKDGADPKKKPSSGDDGSDDGKPYDAGTVPGRHDEAAGRPQGREDGGSERHLAQNGKQYLGHPQRGGVPGAYAPQGTAAPKEGTPALAGGAAGRLAKDGKALTLRFVLPSGAASENLRTVADRISAMLLKVGIRTDITKVPDASYFKDHVAAGAYDLALYSWPATAYPATDARPVYAKPVPAADGSLNVEQNYTRVGTDQVDQLFDRAAATLDEDEERALVRKADSRIWAAAASIPLYQRPQLTAARRNLANIGAFGFRTPAYEDMGFLRKGAAVSPTPAAK
ncbi:ABC transporter family substrate-binding protein [Streptomyces sp. NPDC047000]|uniref:ABC transporter family substrate-binding protein n=1 Tax=Streptomyces sp. NPDC047000 TaxID=3155474 RepID=UPI0033FFD4ED